MKKILTLDDFYLLHNENVRRVLCQPRWSRESVFQDPQFPAGARFFSVIPGETGGYDLFYSTFRPDYPIGMQTGAHTVALAHSADEKTFRTEKVLGPGGSHGYGVAVYRDETAAPENRYKAVEADIFDRQPDGSVDSGPSYCVASPDGRSWNRISDREVLPKSCLDCQPGIVKNPYTGKYQMTLRRAHGDRRISLVESEDFVTWSEPKCVLHPGTPLDAPGTHFYSMPHFYVKESDIFIGFLWKLHMPYDRVSDGPMTTELVYSYDGTIWNRTLHTLLPVNHPMCQSGTAAEDAPLACGLVMSMVEDGEGMLLYALTSDYEHHRHPEQGQVYYKNPVARLRKDGFACYRAGEAPGEAMTIALRPRESAELYLNYRTLPRGSVKAALCDPYGNGISGFGPEDSLLPEGDFTHQPLRWRGGTWAEIAEAHPWIRLKLCFANAEIYSIGGDFYAAVNHSGILYDRP